jgi:hypothetical protein
MNRKRLLLVGAAILGVFSAVGLLATNFQIYEVSAGNYALTMWPGIAPTITWNENFTESAVPSNVTENAGVTATNSLTNAFNTWQNATNPTDQAVTNISFAFGTASASLPQAPTLDCKNVIGFADPNASTDFSTGVIAFALISTTPNGDIPGSNCPAYTTPCPIANCIIDVDIMFNPSPPIPFQSSGTGGGFATANATSNQYDLQSIATHEIGHLMGLDHSNIAHAVMYPYGDTSSIGVHSSLWTDDLAGVGHLYPGPGTADGSGIKGTVTLGGNGLYAAVVQAIDATTGNVVTESLTDPSGNYQLRLYNGTYYVYVQSLAPYTYTAGTPPTITPNMNAGPCWLGNFKGQAGYDSTGGNQFSNVLKTPPPTNYTGAFY